MTTSEVTITKLIPSEGKRLRNTDTGEVFEGELFIAKSLSADDFEEITDEEYQKIIEEKETTNNE